MSFPKYEVYKDSGVEWLGKVPEQWKVVPFSLAIEYQEGPGIMTADFHDEGVPLLRISGVHQRWANLQGCNYLDPAKVKSKWSHFQLEHGDLLISASASMGTICEIGEEAVGAIPYTGLIRLKPRRGFSDKNFVRFIVGSFQFSTQIDLFKAGSTIQHFGPTHLSQMKVVLPPLSEQTQIARFLDRETARIDALIAEQQRLIELLKEKHQAVISHAVTKGLDQTVPMKDSGVEWLGQVPEHWDICKLSFRYSVDLGKMLDEKKITGSNLLPYLRNQDVRWNEINTESLPQMDIFLKELERYTLKCGDLVVCEGGDVGRAAIWRDKDSVIGYQKALHRLRSYSQETDTTEFFFFCLVAAKACGAFEESDTKTTFSHLTAEKFRQYKFVFPPLAEQQKIALILNEKMKQSDSAINIAEQNINLLQERRSTLISAAVTGKIDVRNWQPSPEPAHGR